MVSDPSTSTRPSPAQRLRSVRHALARRRRWLAAACALVAVGATVAALRPAPPATSTVVVAAAPLAAGTVLEAADLVTVAVPPEAAPPGRLAVDELVGAVVAAPVDAREPLTSRRIVGASALAPAEGEVTVPIRLPDAGVASLLGVGDVVDVLATDAESGTTRTAARDVRVVALPPDDGDVGAAGLGGRLVVVAAPRETAVTLAGAAVHHFLTIAFTN
ncbi:pilus assembly protein CpaB [Nocardioides zeae]|uniref:Pilus assembly protein CpaB n=1 Tax=Nocardioides zeae TaxID=1457234 RepID=A0ACC6IJT1_9ACTN|nr:SAF domain-containing protein [Nocardioides zeae]MDR6173588.1 pilus assembly protein CpaB [Nocardioides zeae]MDR6210993.1 pilus assembly protein CpaB [Nocardioides zeae]